MSNNPDSVSGDFFMRSLSHNSVIRGFVLVSAIRGNVSDVGSLLLLLLL